MGEGLHYFSPSAPFSGGNFFVYAMSCLVRRLRFSQPGFGMRGLSFRMIQALIEMSADVQGGSHEDEGEMGTHQRRLLRDEA